MKSIPDSWRIMLLIAIVALGFAFRFYQLEILPSWNSDEGRWAIGPATGAMYGDWSKGGTRYSFVSPTWTRFLYLDFLLVGPSILHARWASALLGLLCVPLIYQISVRSGLGPLVGLLGALFFALDTCSAMVSRQALSDSALTAGIVAGFALFLGGTGQRLLSVIVVAAAICAKPTGIFAPAVMFLCQLSRLSVQQRPRLHRYVKAALIPMAAIGLACAWFLSLYLRHPSEFTHFWYSEFALRKTASAYFYNPFIHNGLVDAIKYYFLRMPLLLATGIVGVIWMLKRKSPANVLPLWWLALSVAVVAVQNHQPTRYYLPAIPALCICAGYAVARLLEANAAARSAVWIRKAGAALAVTIVLYSVGSWYVYYFVSENRREPCAPEAMRWIDSNLPRNAKVFGISMWGVGRRCDYYPLELHVSDYVYPESFIRKAGIQYIVYDDREWGGLVRERQMADPKIEIAKHCRLLKQIGDIGVWECSRDGVSQTRPVHGRTSHSRQR